MAELQVQREQEQLLQFYTDYLDLESGLYRHVISAMLKNGERRLVIDLNNLREYDRDNWGKLIGNPMEVIPVVETALRNVAISLAEGARNNFTDEVFHVGFTGSIPQNELNPRSLMANFLGQLVILEGIVTRCSLVRPKVRKSVHYCPETKNFYAREYRDATLIGGETVTSNVYPTDDGEGHALETEFGFCRYYDFQTIAIQEMPERAPTGQIPRSVDVILNADLVDLVKPGDRVRIYGVYKSLGGLSSAGSSASFKTLLIANTVTPLTKSVYSRAISDRDIETIKSISRKKNVVNLLASSLAPSIYGSEVLKKAVLMLLLGGAEKNLSNGTHIRGDINILMIGDPSTAKSQMLRFVLKMAPLAVATTGRGSSGVGLTAAVVSDKDTGERRLEAGAMVLADRGVVCIDEFDKMSDIDRVAIHEVMEQQTVTIAKAGIHTSLNARCSVIAAANPIYGQYDNRLSPAANAALPDSLMSRFDLVFVVLDQINASLDRTLSRHVLSMHRYVPPNLEEGDPINELMANINLQQEEEQDDDSPYEKHHPFVTAAGGRSTCRVKLPEVLKVSFLKKYIHYAKSRVKPVLSEEASDIIAERYAEFRAKATQIAEDKRSKVFPVTPRTLEALIRLSTAHAKARLSPLVEAQDAEAACELINYSFFREMAPVEKPKTKKAKTNNANGANDDDDDKDSSDGEYELMNKAAAAAAATSEKKVAAVRGKATGPSDATSVRVVQSSVTGSQGNMSMLLDDSSSVAMTSEVNRMAAPVRPAAPQVTLSDARYEEFCGQVNTIRLEKCMNTSAIEQEDLLKDVKGFSQQEMDAAMRRMQSENKLMIADTTVYFMG
ncbi:hypothetical protein MIR68_007187 [Amoeboaphelidium protococcarum]|nr:hypothetical protein MIR68_007187 [Amoeboaphelidium protococcarum]